VHGGTEKFKAYFEIALLLCHSQNPIRKLRFSHPQIPHRRNSGFPHPLEHHHVPDPRSVERDLLPMIERLRESKPKAIKR
jgi:hypothetical protein